MQCMAVTALHISMCIVDQCSIVCMCVIDQCPIVHMCVVDQCPIVGVGGWVCGVTR